MRRPHEPVEPTDVEREVGHRLQAIRIARGLSRAELASRLDTTEAEVIAWETASEVIYVDELTDICKVLQITPDTLLGWETKQ